MLRELHISGLGVIEDLDLPLHPGLNVLTGETGAGKTMITVGLSLALGARASSSLVREGASAAGVQALFDVTAASPDATSSLEDWPRTATCCSHARCRSRARGLHASAGRSRQPPH